MLATSPLIAIGFVTVAVLCAATVVVMLRRL